MDWNFKQIGMFIAGLLIILGGAYILSPSSLSGWINFNIAGFTLGLFAGYLTVLAGAWVFWSGKDA